MNLRTVAGGRRQDAVDDASGQVWRGLDGRRQLLEDPAYVAEFGHGCLAVAAAGQMVPELRRGGGLQGPEQPVGGFGVGEIDQPISRHRYPALPGPAPLGRRAAPAFRAGSGP